MIYRDVEASDRWFAVLAEAEAIHSNVGDDLAEVARAMRGRVERALDEAVAVADAKTANDPGAIDDIVARLKSAHEALEPLIRHPWREVLRRAVEKATVASKAEEAAEFDLYYAANEKSVDDRARLAESRECIEATIGAIEAQLALARKAAEKIGAGDAGARSSVYGIESRLVRLVGLVGACERYR